MSQKLSAMTYIKNNKRRIAVPIVSLCLCFVLTYITGFLLSSTDRTLSSVYLDDAEKIQYISLSDEALGLSYETSPDTLEERLDIRNKAVGDLGKKLEKHDGINKVYSVNIIYGKISPAIGMAYITIPMTDKDTVPVIIDEYGAQLAEGRLPENPGEIVIDRASMDNEGDVLGGYYNYDEYKDKYKIVGVLASDCYFGCGIPDKDDYDVRSLLVFSGIHDMKSELKKENITLTSNDSVYDYDYGEKMIQTEVTDAIGASTTYIYGGILIILTVLLLVVYTMYLRERHNEWCLYSSIGFSRTSIYLSIMKEILFTFITALLSGAVLIIISVTVLKLLMIDPYGLKCNVFDLESIVKILCAYVLLIGVLQIPIYYALFRIRTVDAIEDDLY